MKYYNKRGKEEKFGNNVNANHSAATHHVTQIT